MYVLDFSVDTAKLYGNRVHQTVFHRRNARMHSNSCLVNQDQSYVIYFELIHTNKEFMSSSDSSRKGMVT